MSYMYVHALIMSLNIVIKGFVLFVAYIYNVAITRVKEGELWFKVKNISS